MKCIFLSQEFSSVLPQSYLNRAYGIVDKEDRLNFSDNRLGAPFVLPDFTRTNNNDQENGEKVNLGFQKFIAFGLIALQEDF